MSHPPQKFPTALTFQSMGEHKLLGDHPKVAGAPARVVTRGCPQPTPAYPDADCGQNHHLKGINGGSRRVGLIEGPLLLEKVRPHRLLEVQHHRGGWRQSLGRLAALT